MTKRIVLSLTVMFLVIAGLMPILTLVIRSVVVDGRFSLEAYRDLLGSQSHWVLLGHSLALSGLTALTATLVGVPLGLALGKTDLPLRRTFTVLFCLPLLLPPYILAVSWFHVLGREGLVSRLLGSSAGIVTSDWLFGLWGCAWVLSSIFMPVVLLLTLAFVRSVNPRLEEAARLVSAWPDVLGRVTLPLILPAILLGALLVFILSAGEFGVPHFLRYDVFPVETFSQFAAFYDFKAATAAALPLVGLTLLALVLERLYLRKRTFIIQSAAHGHERLSIGLGHWRSAIGIGVGVLCLLWVVLPLSTLLIASLSWDAYQQAMAQAGQSLIRSLCYAAIGASILTLIGFLAGYLIYHRAFRYWLALDSMMLFFFALPGTVLGIGLILLWNRPATNVIYASPVILLLGWMAQYCALTGRISLATLGMVPPSMEEAARVAGAQWLRRLLHIVLPLARPGLIVAWLAGFLFCMRDTGIAMVVYPPGADTLPVRTFTLMANGAPDMIAALCMIMVLGTLVPLGILGRTLGAMRAKPWPAFDSNPSPSS